MSFALQTTAAFSVAFWAPEHATKGRNEQDEALHDATALLAGAGAAAAPGVTAALALVWPLSACAWATV